MKKYKEGYELKENEYMLKIRDNTYVDHKGETHTSPDTGFMTKFNKSGSMPVAFDGWGTTYHQTEKLPIFIIEEVPREGWKLQGMRFGESQNWAILLHPLGFTVEVHAQNYRGDAFMDILLENDLIKGELKGSYYWEPTKLIKHE